MRVLYVCTGNSFRSVVAEALTRKFRPGLEVESAGTAAVDHVAGNARELLEQEAARKYVKPSPDQVSERAVREADLVVAMMPQHRAFLEHSFDLSGKEIEVWNVKDPVNPGVDPGEAFEQIKGKVEGIGERSPS